MWQIYFARDGICLFLNFPRIGHIHFWFCSRFQIDHVPSSRKAHFKNLEMPFFPLNGAFQDFWTWKVGNFKNNARYRFETEKRIENEYVRFWGIFKTNKNAITCKIYNKNTFCSISINSPLLRNWVLILGSYLTGLCL